jgi:transmembrane sensor
MSLKKQITIPQHLLSAVNDFLDGKATPEERTLVMEWMDQIAISEENEELIYEGDFEELEFRLRNKVLMEMAKDSQPAPIRKLPWLRYVAAAAVIIALSYGAFVLLSSKSTSSADFLADAPKPNLNQGNLPGKEGAILTLDDGSMVVLDSMSNGVIAHQPGTQVVLNNGSLAYDLVEKPSAEMAYNTLSTPKGRLFQIVLADGTKVWMNATSSLKFPTFFKGNNRIVEVTGEVYFEVASNDKMPFIVKVNETTEIEVLGTHFNINSYEDENEIKTTLLEGSIRLTNGNSTAGELKEVALLKPGQQARIKNQMHSLSVPERNNKPRIQVSNADTEKVMAWKNGLFNFENAGLGEVMRQIARWYDIEVVYEKGIPEIYFAGEVSRNVSLDGILKGLEGAGVHFRKDGKKLVVLP